MNLVDALNRLIQGAVEQWLADQVRQIANWLLRYTADLLKVVWLVPEPWVQSAYQVTSAVAWSLLGLRATFDAMRLYQLRSAGEPHLDPLVWFRRTVLGAAAVAGSPSVVGLVTLFANLLTDDLARAGFAVDVQQWAETIVTSMFAPELPILLAALFVILMLLGLLLLHFQAAIRGAELAVAYVAGPILAVSVAGNDDFLASGTFGVWWRELLVVTLTQAVQMFVMYGVIHMTLGKGFDFRSFVLAMALIWVGVTSPRVLRTYAYSSGFGRATMSAATHAAVQMLAKAVW